MTKLNIMFIGAHPDDCDFGCGGMALKFVDSGHRVMFLSMTDGCMGHHINPGPAMASRRRSETRAVESLCKIEYRVLDIPDGSLTSELNYRDMLMREIRSFAPNVMITHRPNDYHPDHRNTGVLVMDCSYMVMVPGVTPDIPPLKKAPYIFYMYDSFTFPGPFKADVVFNIDDVMERKTAMLNCHVSQVYEWLPWVEGRADEVPPAEDAKARFEWLKTQLEERGARVARSCRELLRDNAVKCCEALQLCEYGAQSAKGEISGIF